MSTTGLQGHLDNIKQFGSLTFKQKVSYLLVGFLTMVLPALYYFVGLVAPIWPANDRAAKGDLVGTLGHMSYLVKGDGFMGVLVDSLSGGTTIIQGTLPAGGGVLYCTSNGWLDGAQLHAVWSDTGCLEGLCVQPGKNGFGFSLKPLPELQDDNHANPAGGLLSGLFQRLGVN